ncbi:DNA helicase UvrC [Clostridium argentinense]|nr:DNA helicase UvrC [Clostridium argentinense]NFP50542.1 DNA helicase UvrC [Clostridium argentinense]NFP72852.1 DNA helicase UvrC [Clostridium argentinense]NFP77636.1 DNA helicase UvrC [Clostridium argentinense]
MIYRESKIYKYIKAVLVYGGIMVKQKIKDLKECPGVYLMKDSLNIVIYVGKSKNLRRRVSSYFGNKNHKSSKVQKLVKNIHDFEYITTDTELEALLLECKLIKTYKPTYNKLLKNNERYPYIKITIKEEFPRVVLCYEKHDDGSLYYGPFTNFNATYQAVNSIIDMAKIRKCSSVSKSACLNYNLNLCLGVCINKNIKNEYMDEVKIIIDYLSLKDDGLIERFNDLMESSALELNFELAAKIRDDLGRVRYLKQDLYNVELLNSNRRLVVIEHIDENYIKIFCMDNNDILYREKYLVKDININFMTKMIFSLFNTGNRELDTVDLKEVIDEAMIINSYLKNNHIDYFEVKDDIIDEKKFAIEIKEFIEKTIHKKGRVIL